MTTIPAAELVNVLPSVLGVGGSALDITGLVLTTNPRIPIGTVQGFPDIISNQNYFGPLSQEAAFAADYFPGFDGSAKKPGSLLWTQYPQAPVSAWVRGGTFGLTLTQLQALNALLNITIDGVLKTATINLASATSFSNAGQLIATALGIQGTLAASFTGVIAANVLTASAVTGIIAVGQLIAGAGVTAGTYVTAFGTGSGGAGTYTLSASMSVGSEGMTALNPAVTFDSVLSAFQINSGTTGLASTITYGSGALATSLNLTQATGAILSPGAAAATPAGFMNALTSITTNWVTFTHLFDPDGGSGNTLKQAFAAWKNTQNNRYGYVCWDTDPAPAASVPASSSLGAILAANADSGTALLEGLAASGWNATTGPLLAAFVMGAAASISFTEKNGRISFAYKAQAGFVATVTDAATALNLGGDPQTANRGNGYNFYGAYAQANANFTWFQRGFVTGSFLWFDSYINQIWLNNSLQNALLNFMKNIRSIPYNAAGSALIEAALADPIAAGLNFRAFAPGAISIAQQAQVNAAAGANISNTLQAQGYYVQIGQADSPTRAARGSPPCKFWYLDRGAVQAITLQSIAVQ